jgi:hypothetical protein
MRRAQFLQGQIPQSPVVERDASRCRIIEPANQFGESAFPDSVFAHDGGHLLGWNMEAEIIQSQAF